MASLYSRKWTVAMRNIGRCLVGTSAKLTSDKKAYGLNPSCIFFT